MNIPLRLLTPEEEAHLSLSGVLSALDPKYQDTGPLVVFDVGGGSSEFILVRRGREPVFAGLPLGVLSLSRARPLGDPPRPAKVADLQEELFSHLQNFYQEHFAEHLTEKPTLVGTAGSVTTLAAMAQEMAAYDPEKVNNYILTKEKVTELAGRLAALPEAGTGPAYRSRTRQGRGHGGRGPHRPNHPHGLWPGASGGHRCGVVGRNPVGDC